MQRVRNLCHGHDWTAKAVAATAVLATVMVTLVAPAQQVAAAPDGSGAVSLTEAQQALADA
ncbi:hypothetical protein ABZ464_41835 [Streptomyces sp. NPDC005820]|uniref:hypothetical protein n=1 Tax=Streptomyces sp. NPDC005820 TaxID=3157069 RepID=UPI00340491E7